MEASWNAWRIHRALEGLAEGERTVIELAYFSGLSQSEVAGFLQIPLGTVKTRTRSGLAHLADALGGNPMSDPKPPTPRFDELIENTDPDRARLGEVHELLTAAGPAPELPPSLRAAPQAPRDGKVVPFARRRYTAVAAVAIAATILFGLGYAVGARRPRGTRPDGGHDRAGRCDRIDRPAAEGCCGQLADDARGVANCRLSPTAGRTACG